MKFCRAESLERAVPVAGGADLESFVLPVWGSPPKDAEITAEDVGFTLPFATRMVVISASMTGDAK